MAPVPVVEAQQNAARRSDNLRALAAVIDTLALGCCGRDRQLSTIEAVTVSGRSSNS